MAVVRALAPRPALLVLDEPASALDPVARRELLRDIVEQAIECKLIGGRVLYTDSTHLKANANKRWLMQSRV